jgi:glutamate 5-kinase
MNNKRTVIKVGTSTLTYENGKINYRRIEALCKVLADLQNMGEDILLVSSGAIGVGMGKAGLDARPTETKKKQALAAIGQCELMFMYDKLFGEYNHTVAQILLTRYAVDTDHQKQNIINTIDELLNMNIIPIINENDSLAVAEIKVGDNDKLSSDVALFLDADLLLIFTDEDGLFDDNPKKNSKARLLRFIPEITPAVLALAGAPGETGSAVSTGGMRSKLEAIRAVVNSGANAFLANGMKVLPHEVLFENALGTLFAGKKQKMNSRRRWLSFVSTPKGSVIVDKGGVKALQKNHSSLLPVGVIQVGKHFDAGDLIEILDESGNRIARGIAQYGSDNLILVLGKKTPMVREILGSDIPEELVHKNDLVLF